LKWYIEFPIVYVIVFLFYLNFFSPEMSSKEGGIIVSLIVGLFYSIPIYLGYLFSKKSYKKVKEKER